MVVKAGWWWEKALRGVRTAYFMAAMAASLLVLALPLAVAASDAVLPCLLISSFTCVKCYGFQEHLRRYSFRSSLVDIPLVSITRSFVIACTYLASDGHSISHGPYFGTVAFSSLASILLLSVKACVFTLNSGLEEVASVSLSRKRLRLKKSWGMPVLFLSSVVFALGHIVVAFRTSYRARRKLFLQRVDPEAVLSCKMVLSGYQKVPRSPTPLAGKTFRCDSEMRRKPPRLLPHDESELPVSSLADQDSLFIFCRGLTVHYKLSFPRTPSRSLSSTTLSEPTVRTPLDTLISHEDRRGMYEKLVHFPSIPINSLRGLSVSKPTLSIPQKPHCNHLNRSISNQFHYTPSTIYTPLLLTSPSSPISMDVPVFSLNENCVEDEASETEPPQEVERVSEASNEQFGIVLVHGFGGGVFSWRNVMGVLSRQTGCAVAAFDRPGWGLTSRPTKKDWEENGSNDPYKIDSQVNLLISFCTEMGFSSVVLVGHDDGGLLVLKAAQKVQLSTNPIKLDIKGVIVMNVSLSRELVPAFARILLRTSLGKKHLVLPLLRMEITQLVNRRAWYDETKLTTEVLSLYKAPLHVEGWDEALHEIGKLSYETVLSPQDAASMLNAVVNLPVLVVAGAEDVIVPVKSVQAMASKLVNSRLVAISGCGHLPHEECPKALLAAISPFITRLLLKPELQSH